MNPQDIAALPLLWQRRAVDIWTDDELRKRSIDPDAFWAQVQADHQGAVDTTL